MFDYSDPTASDLLSRFRAISEWRAFVESWYVQGASRADSAFTFFDVLADLPDQDRVTTAIEWLAYPILNGAEADGAIDTDRFALQEEYVEWAVFRELDGQIGRITFSTEFREYYAILAGVSPAGIAEAIGQLNGGATPTTSEIYGTNSVSGLSVRQRANLFLSHLRNNPWNNGVQGILGLTLGANSFGALFGLAIECGVERIGMPAEDVCNDAGGACVPGRQSDPQICRIAQSQARSNRVYSIADPIGIFISRLNGIWEVDGHQLDINDENSNQGRWVLSHNRRRGTLHVGGNGTLTLDGDQIESGAQISKSLIVAANVVSADAAAIPEWARTGNEFMQRPDERTI